MNAHPTTLSPPVATTEAAGGGATMRERLGPGLGIAVTILAVFAIALGLRGGVPATVLALSPDVAVALLAPVCAALILQRHPGHTIGWLLLVAGASSALYGFTTAAGATLAASDGASSAVLWLTWVASWVWYPSFAVMMSLFPLLFPSGRPSHPAFVPVVWVTVGVILVRAVLLATEPIEFWQDVGLQNPLGLEVTGTLVQLLEPGLDVVWPLLIAAAILSLAGRLWHGDADTRARIGWVAIAAAVGAVVQLVTGNGTLLAIAVPSAALLAITRRGLFAIDRFAVRAIVYGALTLLVTVLHVSIAMAVGGPLALDGEVLGVRVGVTLLAVLLFQPVHRWLDRSAERIVHGQRTRPDEVLGNLARRLAETIVPDDVPTEISTAVGAALDRPAQVVLGPTPPLTEGTAFAVEHGNRIVAHIVVDVPGSPLTPAEEALVRDVAAQSGPALHNLELRQELQEQLSVLEEQSRKLKASRARLVSAQDRERRRMERDLHDGVQQRLLALGIELGRRAEGAPVQAEELRDLQAQTEEITDELRRLARGMYPSVLTDLGVEAALRTHIAQVDAPVRLDASLLDRYPAAVETAIYFGALEAITNAVRHGGAGLVDVQLHETDSALVLRVSDDGTGFDISAARHAPGRGLENLRDRCGAVGGTATVASSPGTGTVVTLVVPIDTDRQPRAQASDAPLAER